MSCIVIEVNHAIAFCVIENPIRGQAFDNFDESSRIRRYISDKGSFSWTFSHQARY